MNKHRSVLAIALALVAGGLLVASLRLPLWHMRMEAPQYRGSEALKVVVRPGSLSGDLNEIKILNQYIGVTVPEALPQTHWLPQALLVAAALGVVAAFLCRRWRRFTAFGVATALVAMLVVAAAQAQMQMYHIGHDRDRHAALKGVDDFTPPLLGSRKLAQFELESSLGFGSFTIGGAIAIFAFIGFTANERSASVRNADASIEVPAPSTNSSEVAA